jgi:hypothetical protein
LKAQQGRAPVSALGYVSSTPAKRGKPVNVLLLPEVAASMGVLVSQSATVVGVGFVGTPAIAGKVIEVQFRPEDKVTGIYATNIVIRPLRRVAGE